MEKQSIYFNDKLVSIHLYHQEKVSNGLFTYSNILSVPFLFFNRTIKLKNYKFIDIKEVEWTRLTHEDPLKFTFEFDEFQKYLDKVYNGKYQHIGSVIYYKPRIVFKYINGDEKVMHFKSNSDAEDLYNKMLDEYKNLYTKFT